MGVPGIAGPGFTQGAKNIQPQKFVRSTSVGANITTIAVGVGTLATPHVEKLRGAERDLKELDPDRIKHFL